MPEPTRIPAIALVDSRDATAGSDAKLINGFLEKDQYGEVWVNKRPGLITLTVGSTGNGSGCYFWEYTASLFYVAGTSLRRSNLLGTDSLVSAVPTDVYTFDEITGSTPKLFVKGGSNAYYYVFFPESLTKITDVNYPASTVPGSCYLDGTMYVMDTSGVIWGSKNLNDLSAWDPLNRIVPQVDPAYPVRLAKQSIYVVAFMDREIEFFYDAGVAVGSPLLPIQNAKISMGCLGASTVRSVNDVLYFQGTNKTSTPAIYAIKALQLRHISTPAIDKLLAVNPGFNAWTARRAGHDFYGLQSGSYTLVFDITEEVWYIWQEQNSAYNNTPYALDIVGSASSVSGFVFLQATNAAKFRSFSPTATVDADPSQVTQPLITDIVCPNYDGGVRLKKVLSKLRLVADAKAGGSLLVRWSDDDYKTWSPWITVDLTSASPQLTNLGTFRRRAFQFRHQSPAPFRMKACEPEIALGSA